MWLISENYDQKIQIGIEINYRELIFKLFHRNTIICISFARTSLTLIVEKVTIHENLAFVKKLLHLELKD